MNSVMLIGSVYTLDAYNYETCGNHREFSNSVKFMEKLGKVERFGGFFMYLERDVNPSKMILSVSLPNLKKVLGPYFKLDLNFCVGKSANSCAP